MSGKQATTLSISRDTTASRNYFNVNMPGIEMPYCEAGPLLKRAGLDEGSGARCLYLDLALAMLHREFLLG